METREGQGRKRSREVVIDAWNGARGDEIDLFVYGTLMSDSHVRLLLNRDVESEIATLDGYMKIIPPGAFFFIVRQLGAQVKGRLLKGLTKEEIQRIDEFEVEGKLYFRRQVVVRDHTGYLRRCQTYIGNIPALQHAFAKEIHFEDRYSDYLDRKIDWILSTSPSAEEYDTELKRASLRELMGSEINSLVESHFDGDYICNYIMSQTFSDARPPDLNKVFANEEIKPYADSYMKFACAHIIFNQLAERIQHDFHDAVRVQHKYYRHGTSALLALRFYNLNRESIEKLMHESQLDAAIPGRTYGEYAVKCIQLVENVYSSEKMKAIIDYVGSNWYSTPTPLGAELEFSCLGARAVYAEPGEDPLYDSFYWYNDFDLARRTWRLGGHVDAHRTISMSTLIRHRGFLEYALGRFNIAGDLSRPLFDCPWAMSMIINEAVKFIGIPPHSLHVSMELPKIHGQLLPTDRRHTESDLVCLLMLGGDIHPDENGDLKEWRICNNELDTNSMHSLNFLDRKHHYFRPNDEESGAEVMEYKFLRLRKEETDYARIIFALKGYQIETCARPVTIARLGQPELPEQLFMREWAKHPQALSTVELNNFVSKVESGLKKEHNSSTLDKRGKKALENLYTSLKAMNDFVSGKGKKQPDKANSNKDQ